MPQAEGRDELVNSDDVELSRQETAEHHVRADVAASSCLEASKASQRSLRTACAGAPEMSDSGPTTAVQAGLHQLCTEFRLQ